MDIPRTLERLQEDPGDGEAWLALSHHLEALVRRRARTWPRDFLGEADVEVLVGELFGRMMERLGRAHDPVRHPVAYLVRSVDHALIDLSRRRPSAPAPLSAAGPLVGQAAAAETVDVDDLLALCQRALAATRPRDRARKRETFEQLLALHLGLATLDDFVPPEGSTDRSHRRQALYARHHRARAELRRRAGPPGDPTADALRALLDGVRWTSPPPSPRNARERSAARAALAPGLDPTERPLRRTG